MSDYLHQSVNLYLPEMRPRVDWLSPQRFSLVVLVSLALVAGLAGYGLWERSQRQQTLAGLEAQIADETAIAEQMESTLIGSATDEGLVGEVAARQASIATLTATLETLRAVNQGNLLGFATYLKNLSRASSDGLWLTRINISNGGSSALLEGYAMESALVPSFIEKLSAGWEEGEGWRFSHISGLAPGEVAASATTPSAALDLTTSAAIEAASGAAADVAALVGGGASSALTADSQAYRFVLEAR
jgi:hypothetical protein